MTKMLLAKRWLQQGSSPARSAVRVALATVPTDFGLISTNAASINNHVNDTITCGCRDHRTFRPAVTLQQHQIKGLSRSVLPSHQRNQFSVPRRLKSTAAATYDSDEETSTDSTHQSTSTNIIPFKLADIGEGIKEVELLQWFVQEGDRVRQFDNICEVQSDKATVEITSRYDGIVESLAGGKVGDMVQVGDPLLFIQVEGSSAPAGDIVADPSSSTISETATSTPLQHQAPQILHSQHSLDDRLHIPHVASKFHLDSDKASSEDNVDTLRRQPSGGGKFLATPAVRKLGMEHNLDISTLIGSGPKGRVLKSDVLTFLRENGHLASESVHLEQEGPASHAAGVLAEELKPATSAYSEEDQVVTLKGYNRLMIQTMSASLNIPHMGYTDEFNLTKLASYRQELSPKVSMLAFFIKATSLALKEYPMINASWKDVDKGEVTVWASHNIGVAMDTPRGLVVPVVFDCQNKSLLEIEDNLRTLKETGAAGKLTVEHLKGATFSLSNIGSLGGGTYMNPLIVPPQSGIGAMGTVQTLPRFDDGGNVIAAKIMPISWAGDHRMIDGATLARFSNLCKHYLENPVQMMVSMK